ncbi:Outer membrane protein assembly factor BamB, contains PQQ-like beta-propeller repeat [Cognatiyoonia koreensis]|uniref:Outer membrane protein assembly factor BamB, contains PQQ-like beta-propeller repeat n=1 Tax=Cognatiyoonia koreensis TaxID=364200 RepID=A0A1I0NNP7_9RHOB|nr:PQQ-like beta-propeller repeat protein [Cognatiyoonia koreensis]SEW02983.1 Outer membrane protein assembly factor BamB, contains PQQ-like beta-propeller repeat [Cognatiyoonia koreensis]
MISKSIIGATLGLALLAACGETDVILPGERLSIRPDAAIVNETRGIRLPAQVSNANWTHRNGGPDHRTTHPALSPGLAPVFAVNIGEGDSRKARITADPVVSGGVIYTLDARSRVSATTTAGQPVWSSDLTPRSDGATDASGGGIAVGGNTVFVTTGFGELTALDASTGAIFWRQDLDAPGTSAPTVFGDLVYVVSRDNTAWAIDVTTGRIRWTLAGTPSVGNFSGGAGAAVTSDIAIFPFGSGEVIATFPQGGLRRWSTVVTGERLGQAAANISDIAGDPVIDGNTVYVGNFSGRVVAMNVANGERLWTASEGTLSPVWPAGDSVFLVNDLNELVRLDAATGIPVWKTALPSEVASGLLFRTNRSVVAHYGPVLAGGRLIVGSSDGLMREFDPQSGALIGTAEISGGAASNPVVAGQTLYVVSKAGQLVAFR